MYYIVYFFIIISVDLLKSVVFFKFTYHATRSNTLLTELQSLERNFT